MAFPSWIGESIDRLTLHRRASPLRRLDTSPFIALHFVSFFVIVRYELSRFSGLCILVISCLLHILSLLAQQWSVRVKTFMSWVAVKELKREEILNGKVHALCKPHDHQGKDELVPVEIDDKDRIYFVFQKRTYEYDDNCQTFREVLYPTHYPLRDYTSYARTVGGLSKDEAAHASARFGANKLIMPVPTFAELYKQALLAPFFVFQAFCIFLWLLDEYWKFSLMTFVMMLIFEATVVQGRLRSLREIRGMRNPATNLYVFRDKKWALTSSHELLPGDLVSICRSRDASDLIPCDLLILSGSVIVNEAMLTGESVPLMKESISSVDEKDLEQRLSMEDEHKNYVLFGGTRILTQTSASGTQSAPSAKCPDGGCVCYVLRTGFGSSQGKLMRTILYSTESVSANSSEAAMFILFLLVFAVAASGYLLYHRYTEDHEGRYKLLLRCILIITSVVPPDLPMQLALAVNTSLIALVRNMVFCTEPYRIPFAGKIDICCFDKTGTLTTDSLKAAGVVMPSTEGEDSSDQKKVDASNLVPVNESSVDAALVLAACHSLVYVDHDVMGDPLETAALHAVDWNFSRDGVCTPKRGGMSKASAKILKIFRFASSLQRMSSIVDVNGSSPRNGPRVLVKGSSEAIGKLLLNGNSEEYAETARRLERAGMRVLALAYKDLDAGAKTSEIMKMSRDEAESNLSFAGFVCFDCPVRTDSRKVVRMLRKSNHLVSMITGDSTLTAAHVATLVGICTSRVLILGFSEVEAGSLEWFSASSGKRLKRFSVDTIEDLSHEFDLCIGGTILQAAVTSHPGIRANLRFVKVFARMTPQQKELILTAMKESGLITLMCGDGTNDVGALKQAHVGVALLSSPLPQGRGNQAEDNLAPHSQVGEEGSSRSRTKPRASELRARRKSTKTRAKNERAQGSNNAMRTKSGEESHVKVHGKENEAALGNLLESDDQPPLVKLGDASIASPFTSRRMTIDSCLSIIRQGRCTLATTLQMYQILALTCLISAYSLSVLYLEGVVVGDKQMTIIGLVLNVAAIMASRSKPLKKLSAERPASSVFAPQMFFSMMGQFAIHIAALIMCVQIVKPFLIPGPLKDEDEEFTPTILNSAIFLLTVAQQISVYVLNYKGRPHMQGIRENKPLLNSLLVATAILVVCTLEVSSDLNEFMELVPWPSQEVKLQVGGLICFDMIGSFIVDKIVTVLFHPRLSTAVSSGREG